MSTAEERLEKYLASVKRANQKYRETHRDLVNEKRRSYYAQKTADEEFMAKKREHSRAQYQKKKQLAMGASVEASVGGEISN